MGSCSASSPWPPPTPCSPAAAATSAAASASATTGNPSRWESRRTGSGALGASSGSTRTPGQKVATVTAHQLLELSGLSQQEGFTVQNCQPLHNVTTASYLKKRWPWPGCAIFKQILRKIGLRR